MMLKKIPWIAWKKVLSPSKYGGLGVGSLAASNRAMLAKWWWGFRIEPEALRCKVIKSIHGDNGSLQGNPATSSGPWYQVSKLQENQGRPVDFGGPVPKLLMRP